jgi:ferredoxin/NAD(P)H-dependent FMN reductase
MFSNKLRKMKITIILFSPSGSSKVVTQGIIALLESKHHDVNLLDITGDDAFFNRINLQEYLAQRVTPHDVLLVGGPVYAHHMQYHVLDLIKSLPKPNDTWGKLAIPYVTYGGISSGVALKESRKFLRETGRIVPLAMKIVAPHRMTRAFMSEEFNNDKLKGEQLGDIEELVYRIGLLNPEGKVKDAGRSLHYNGIVTTLLAKTVFIEKTWHEKRYPRVVIDQDACTGCGKCTKGCPVNHLRMEGKTIMLNAQSDCIHCLNCVLNCPSKAVSLQGDLEKGRAFMSNMIAKKGNRETPGSAVYPLSKKTPVQTICPIL